MLKIWMINNGLGFPKVLLRSLPFFYADILYKSTEFAKEAAMKVELTIDCTKKLPDGAMSALQKELLTRSGISSRIAVWSFAVLVRMV